MTRQTFYHVWHFIQVASDDLWHWLSQRLVLSVLPAVPVPLKCPSQQLHGMRAQETYFLGVVYVIVVFIRAHLSYIFTMKTPSCTSRSEVIESSSARKPSVSDVSKRSIGTSSLENIIDMLRLIVWYGSHWYEHI
uniref:Uncharacterized protein n=1 Tax=Glossina palpalis gambiensis TaxID=67801 RepID=A0A1B0BYS7_9MUSC